MSLRRFLSCQRGVASAEMALITPMALLLLFVADGRAEDGLRSAETAMRLNPRYPFWYVYMRGMTRYA